MSAERAKPLPGEHQQQPANVTPIAGGAPEPRRLDRLQTTAQVVIAGGVVLTLIYLAKLPLVVLLVSVLLAFILAPLVDFFRNRARLPRPVAALLATLVFFAALGAVVYFSYNSAQAFTRELPKYRGELQGLFKGVQHKIQGIQRTANNVLPQSPEDKHAVKVQQAPSWSDWITHSIGSVTEVVLAASFIPFLAYFMLSWQEHARSATVMLFSMENRNTAYVTLGAISSMIRSFILGNLLIGLFISAVSTTVFALVGVPYFYFVGVLSGFLSLVPYLGVLLAVVPPLLVGVGHLHATGFAAVAVTALALHLFAFNVLYPKYLGSRLQLNPLAVTVALFFWGWMWGAMGLLLAIPITAAMKIICDNVVMLRPYGEWLGE